MVCLYTDGDGLSRFFRGLAQAWRGWEGTKEWRPIENDLLLSARHDGIGHIALSIQLSEDSGYSAEGWVGRSDMELVAGDLERIADEAEREFGVI